MIVIREWSSANDEIHPKPIGDVVAWLKLKKTNKLVWLLV
jgi:hypothetical protein